jgi:hypothetical protein
MFPLVVLCWAVGAILLCGILIRTLIFSRSKNFQVLYLKSYTAIEKYTELYNTTYTLAMDRKKPPDLISFPSIPSRPYTLISTYAAYVKDCSITVVIMDDKLSRPQYDYGKGQPLWFMLESIGVFAPKDACVLLMTSDCAMKSYLGESADDEAVKNEIAKGIYEQSLPLFRKTIESGRVRLSFLNHDKYHVPRCSDFGSSNNALLHHDFWMDEFEDRDSNHVMIIDQHSVLCYPLIAEHMTEFAHVGSVWPKSHNPLQRDFLEGPCQEMPRFWHSWTRPQRRHKGEHGSTMPLREKLPEVCDGNRAPVGSGGLSLRDRRWMRRAIETCPHVAYSGLDPENADHFLPCKVFDEVNEDVYFATVLQGMDAPLPNAYLASLFAAEALWPEEVSEVYFTPSDQHAHNVLVAKDRPKITSVDGDVDLVIPNGVHKTWWYHPDEMLRSEVMADSCPFLPYIYTSNMNRYDEYTQEKQMWIGVGS